MRHFARTGLLALIVAPLLTLGALSIFGPQLAIANIPPTSVCSGQGLLITAASCDSPLGVSPADTTPANAVITPTSTPTPGNDLTATAQASATATHTPTPSPSSTSTPTPTPTATS